MGSFAPLARRNHVEKARFVLAWLDQHAHFGANRHNRVALMCRRVIAAEGTLIPEGSPDYPSVLLSFQDLQEYEFIAEAFVGVHLSPLVVERIKRSLPDPEVPRDDAARGTRGRDAQFELLVGAIGIRGGLQTAATTTEHGQPDWLFDAPGRGSWAVEVKRVKSSDAFRERVQDAVSQIEASGRTGVIVVDISQLDNLTLETLPATVPDSQLRLAHQMTGREAARFCRERVFPTIRHALIGGIVVHTAVRRQAGNGPGLPSAPLLLGLWNFVGNRLAKRKTRRRAERLYDDFMALGMPGMEPTPP